MATVLSAYDLKKGKTAQARVGNSLVQPIQMLPNKQKNDEWKRQNMDWWEQLGIRQLNAQFKRLYKLGRLADGKIDKKDYIPEQGEAEYDLIQSLTKEFETPYDIKYYPIIPNVVNVLTGEFSKRNSKILIDTVDEFSTNELLEQKRQMVEDFLVAKARQAIAENLAKQGIPIESEEAEQAYSQIGSLPQLEEFFKKDYKSIGQLWATKQVEADSNRFNMYELENIAFRDNVTYGREFWHINLKETDYEVEVWDPINTFAHYSNAVRYVSEGDYAGRIMMMSISDVINRYGYLMKAEQIESLEQIHNRYNQGLVADGQDFTAHYDTTRTPDQQQPNSIFYERLTAARSMWMDTQLSFPYLDNTQHNLDTPFNQFSQGMVRVSEIYWKSQRRLGHLTKIDIDGNVTQEVITEDYKVTDKPIYDTSLIKDKSKENLVFGEHIDWLWVNEVWKGVKISPNYQTIWTDSVDSFTPLYIDVRPIKFQFKGINDLYGARLPVEGFISNTCITEQMRPFQIGFNVVNNQMADILIDELGTVIVLDQNSLPQHSMGGEWGKNNFSKAYRVMKDFSILPLDTTITNTEVATNFQHFQSIDLSQTQRLMSRVQLAEYFKTQAFEVVGISRQRVGEVTSSESATGVVQAVNNSYSQTEPIFTKHISFLMPRVYEMMINASQYYNATKPSVQLSYINSEDEKVVFSIEGHKLMLRDYNVIPVNKPNHQNVLQELKRLAIENNTTNATIYDLMKIVSSDSKNEVINTAKAAVAKFQEDQQRQMEMERQMQQEALQAQAEAEERERQFKAEQNALDREADILGKQITAMGFADDKDMNANSVPDVLEVAKLNNDINRQNQDMLFRQQEMQANNDLARKQLDIKQQEIEAKERIAQRQLEIARENKTKAELAKQKNKKK